MTDIRIEQACINAESCGGTATARLWTENFHPGNRRHADPPFNQASLVSQSCTCPLSDDDIERIGIFARSRR
jgi:hypothetical protein